VCCVASAGAVVHVPSGNTCTAAGSGTSYTLSITLAANASEQGGFAVGAPGVKVTNIILPNSSGGGGGSQAGTLTTQSLPANTTAAWIMANPALVPGSTVSASLTTSAPVTGSFITLVPANAQHTSYFDAIQCSLSKVTPVSNKFTVRKAVTYNAGTGTWRIPVTVSAPGKLIYNHRTLAPGGTPKPLIQSGRVNVKPGAVTLNLKPSAAGRAALKASGSIKLNLSVEFSPTGGKPANKVVTLNLRR
jgi:hypothetical protein